MQKRTKIYNKNFQALYEKLKVKKVSNDYYKIKLKKQYLIIVNVNGLYQIGYKSSDKDCYKYKKELFNSVNDCKAYIVNQMMKGITIYG